MRPEPPGIYAPMPLAEQFASVMSRIGVGEGTRAVLYDDFLGMYAARIWWMLRAFGFDDAAVLNGGWQKWQREGRPVSTEPAYPPATFVPRPRPALIASKEDVLAAIEDEEVSIVYALLEPEYTGDPPSLTTTGVLVTSRAASTYRSPPWWRWVGTPASLRGRAAAALCGCRHPRKRTGDHLLRRWDRRQPDRVSPDTPW